ncbi:glycoside hydrolase family 5 protein [Laetiporus sulphureus 93-53]|uniref:cellulase n=1 Tax=Laetiporus sulphureus 93-53 TaxID=1314785 RepID=A0A165C8U6_9APHY|nr:glycoside hydrolase family 5 protein [Laetiporus sulphureus 93-53]KZT02401.1 glycoside hydrolase family 5 protein [Laetiporus sulphureus 93-53]
MKFATVFLAVLASTLAPASVFGQFPTRLGGVNTAGYDFSVDTSGDFSGTGDTPPASQYTHFTAEGVNLYRIPFAWQLMTPTLGGTINTTWFDDDYDVTVQAALSSGSDVYVIVDLHNYARWDGEIIGQGGPTNAQFASVWTQLAEQYGSNDRIIFGVMNEPHDLNVTEWVASVQYVVNAIREAGATNYLLLPGSSYSSAETFPTEAGPYLVDVTDPLGGTSKLLFDVHKYLDSDNSGTHSTCVTNNVDVLETLVSFLQDNGDRQAILSETGGGETSSCYTDLAQELAYVESAYPTLVGFSVWAAGAFDTSYVLSVTPYSNGTDQTLWTEAVKPYLP